jgi:hypothetical protein
MPKPPQRTPQTTTPGSASRCWRASRGTRTPLAPSSRSAQVLSLLALLVQSKSGDSDAARALFKKCTGTQFTCFTSAEVQILTLFWGGGADVNPNNAASWQAWGTMERKAGNTQQAATLLERGLRSSPKNTCVRYPCADVC